MMNTEYFPNFYRGQNLPLSPLFPKPLNYYLKEKNFDGILKKNVPAPLPIDNRIRMC